MEECEDYWIVSLVEECEDCSIVSLVEDYDSIILANSSGPWTMSFQYKAISTYFQNDFIELVTAS